MRVCRQFALPYGWDIFHMDGYSRRVCAYGLEYSIWMGILDLCVPMDGIHSIWMCILDVCVPMDGIHSIWMCILDVCVPMDGIYSIWMGASLSRTHE